MDRVCEECSTCQKFGRKQDKPCFSLPLSRHLKNVVAIDLHELTDLGRGVYYLQVIDVSTRFSQACLIFDKTAETIVNAFNRAWIFVFGAPIEVLSDNGREFAKVVFNENAEQFNFSVITTAAYSPWSNGCCERHTMLITETFLKVRASKPSIDSALCLQHAVLAKNMLANVSGFTPYQLLYGKPSNLPGALKSWLPALNSDFSSDVIRKHLVAPNSVRQAFIQVESSERFKRALRCKTRPGNSNVSIADSVFYRSQKWHGPGNVIGRDGNAFLLDMAEVYTKCTILKSDWSEIR